MSLRSTLPGMADWRVLTDGASAGSDGCGSAAHLHRRSWLKLAGLGAGAWLTPLGEQLARAAERDPSGRPAQSLIVLWLQGGPSQLETFDPHPGAEIAAGSRARPTRNPDAQLASGFEQLADLMDKVSLVRSVVSKEGDHERATYHVKTGFRPDPTLVHPAIGAVCAHRLKDNLEIPRHVSILPGQWPARGGYLGAQYDAFKIGDPVNRIPDVTAAVPPERLQQRLNDLDVVERQFARNRPAAADPRQQLHRAALEAALRMMSSEQLAAFDVKQEPQPVLESYGDTPFGRGCLAAVRLVEAGVRCVEVTLDGWDSHIDNHEIHSRRLETLDPAFAALLRDLERRELLERTVVLCAGEFGRTPRMNPAGGRDHWPHGFSVALAGGGIAGGRVVGATSPDPRLDAQDKTVNVEQPVEVKDIHATILHALGIDYAKYLDTPVGRPMIISEGTPLPGLLT